MFELVKQLYDRVKRAQDNVKNICEIINSWGLVPLYERKEGRKDALIDLDNKIDKINKRYELVRNTHSEILKVMEENFLLFFNLPLPVPEEPAPPTEVILII